MDEQGLKQWEQIQIQQVVNNPITERCRKYFSLHRPVYNKTNASSDSIIANENIFVQLDKIEREVPLEMHLCICIPFVLTRIKIRSEKVRQQLISIWILGGGELDSSYLW